MTFVIVPDPAAKPQGLLQYLLAYPYLPVVMVRAFPLFSATTTTAHLSCHDRTTPINSVNALCELYHLLAVQIMS